MHYKIIVNEPPASLPAMVYFDGVHIGSIVDDTTDETFGSKLARVIDCHWEKHGPMIDPDDGRPSSV